MIDLALNGMLRSASWWRAIAFSQLLLLFAQVYRYRRRATTAEREGVRWAILGIIVEVEAFVLVGIAGGGAIGEGPDLLRGLANAAALPIPVAFAIGLLRPRLGNVDAALRLVVGGTIAIGVLAGGYAATTAVARAAGADIAAAGWWGAAAVALLAVPVIRASASLSEWVTYRGRSSPDQAVTRLDAALDEQPDAASAPETVLRTLMEAISLDGAALRGDPVLAASLGDISPVVEEFPVTYQGEQIATLVVPPRRGESELTSRDRQVASRLAIHAAPALHGARALADLKNAHSRLLHAREEERKGLRRDLHDDLSPTLAGLALEAAALSRTAQHVQPSLTVPVSADDHVRGPVAAPVTVVEYGDYECPYCAAALPVLVALIDHSLGQVRLVFRNFPLADVHPFALTAALAAEAAAALGAFWPMHDLLFSKQDRLRDSDLARYAELLGLPGDAVIRDAAQLYGDKIEADFQSGVDSGVRGTPTLFINGRRYEGRVDHPSLRAAVSSLPA